MPCETCGGLLPIERPSDPYTNESIRLCVCENERAQRVMPQFKAHGAGDIGKPTHLKAEPEFKARGAGEIGKPTQL